MDWGRLWAARGCLGTIFKKVQKTPQSSKKATDRLGGFFFSPAPWQQPPPPPVEPPPEKRLHSCTRACGLPGSSRVLALKQTQKQKTIDRHHRASHGGVQPPPESAREGH